MQAWHSPQQTFLMCLQVMSSLQQNYSELVVRSCSEKAVKSCASRACQLIGAKGCLTRAVCMARYAFR